MSKLDLPPYTCPEIDELIKSLSRVEKLVRFSNFSDIDEANDAIEQRIERISSSLIGGGKSYNITFARELEKAHGIK